MMRLPKPKALVSMLVVAGMMQCLPGLVRAQADSSNSMRVGNLQYGDGLDPRGWTPLATPDPRGFSWLRAGMLRTPSGALYPYPPLRQDLVPNSAGWAYWGILQIGYLHTGGDSNAEFFRQYSDWKNGPVLGLFGLYFEKPSTGNYLEFRGSRISGDDQFYRLRAGRYGNYRVQAFYRDMPHAVATDAYPLWDGVGSTNLTLPSPLIPGGSTPLEVAAAEVGRPRRTVSLTRSGAGISIEGELYRKWIGFASVTNEERNGTRLWGGSMFFNFPFADNGGAMETVRPVDFTTTDVSLGLRYVGKQWRFNSIYSGSFFRNHKDYLDFQSPFVLWNVVGTPNVGSIDQGQFSLEPNNDYHNVRLELSRSLKWSGELSLTAAWGTMRQNDALLAPVTCTGQGGIFIAPPADYTFDCANWNTPAALSRRNADARIDTSLLNARATFRPSSKFSWHAELRWYKEDNKTNYLAYNPLTGQYGYISENGSQGSVVPGETGFFDPNNPLYWSYVTQVRSIPFGYRDTIAELGGDWRITSKNSLNFTYTFDHDQPKYRERKRLDEQRVKLDWVNRAVGKGTLRVSYEYARRDGGFYNYNPYEPFYSTSLPGFVPSVNGVLAFTTDAMRKYDMSDRVENKFRAILLYPIGDSATVSATLHGVRDTYSATVGRQNTRNQGATVQWDWQPTPLTNVSGWISRTTSYLRFSNVADNEALVGANPGQADPTFGGPLFPLANQWWDISRERDYNAGLTWNHNFGRARADISYNYTYSRSQLNYNYVSLGALPATQQPFVGQIGTGFPNNHYRLNTLDLGLNLDLNASMGVRLFGRYQLGSFADWHYLGLQGTPVVDHRVYTDRGPHLRYHATTVGVMLNMKL